MPVLDEVIALRRAINRERDARDGADPGPEVCAARVDLWSRAACARLKTLIRRARRLHTLYERECSDSRADADALGAAIVRAEARIVADCRALFPGIVVEFNGDPRGFPVKLLLSASGAGNTWGGGEYGIGGE